MSQNVEEKITRMVFDHDKFDKGVEKTIYELNKLTKSIGDLAGATKTVQALETVASKLSFASIANGVGEASRSFTDLQIVGISVLDAITKKAIDTGIALVENIGNKILGPMRDGFTEYQTQMGAVQTILTNTADKGTKIGDVNKVFAELNDYADKTIYNFAEMTRNIGTFTAAGVDLQRSATAIKGIANLAAGSGSTSAQASTAMYQLSQALAAGSLKLQDWNSVVNAGMGGQLFQNELKKTAKMHGVAVDQIIAANGSFRESLQEGWITADILTETLARFADESTDIGKRLTAAATEVKTVGELFDSMGESMGSVWARLWQTIIGDYDEAKILLTEIFNAFDSVVGGMFKTMNNTAIEWKKLGGRTKLIDALRLSIKNCWVVVTTFSDAFKKMFPPKTGKDLKELTDKFYLFVKSLTPTAYALNAVKTSAESFGALINIFSKLFAGSLELKTIFESLQQDVSKAFTSIQTWLIELSKNDKIFVEAETVWKNIAELASGARDVFVSVFPIADAKLMSNLTSFLVSGLNLLNTVVEDNKDLILSIFSYALKFERAFLTVITTIAKALTFSDEAPKIINSIISGVESIIHIFNKIVNAIYLMAPAISPIVQYISDLIKFASAFLKTTSESNIVALELNNTWAALNSILFYIRKAFKEVFPKPTASAIESMVSFIIKAIHTINDIIFDNRTYIYEIAKAFFNVEKVVAKIISTIAKSAVTSSVLPKLATMLFKIAATIASIINKILESESAAALLKGTFDFTVSLIEHIENHLSGIVKIISNIIKTITGKDLSSLDDNLKSVGINLGKIASTSNTLSSIIAAIFGKNKSKDVDKATENIEDISGTIEEVSDTIEDASNTVEMASNTVNESITVFDNVKKALSNVFKMVGTAINGMQMIIKQFIASMRTLSLYDIGKVFATLMSSKILKKTGKIADALTGVLDNIGDGVEKISNSLSKNLDNITKHFTKFLDALSGTIKSFGVANYAKALKDVAISIAILTAALFVLSILDLDKVGPALGLLTGLLVELIAVMVIMANLTKSSGNSQAVTIAAIGSAFIGMAVSVLILSAALKILTTIDRDALIQSGLAIAALMLMLTMMIGSLTKSASVFNNGAATLYVMGLTIIKMAVAILILALSLKMISLIDPEALGHSVIAIIALMSMMGVVVSDLAKLGNGMKGAAGQFLAMGVSILIISFALKKLSDIDPERMGQSVLAIIALLAIMGVVQSSLAKAPNTTGMAIAIIAFAASMLIIANAIMKLGELDTTAILTAAGAIAALLVVMVYSITIMSGISMSIKAAITTAALIILFVSALKKITDSLASLSKTDPMAILAASAAIAIVLLSMTAFLEHISKTKGLVQLSAIVPTVCSGILNIAKAIATLKDMDTTSIVIAGVALSAILSLLMSLTILLAKQFQKSTDAAKTAALSASMVAIISSMGTFIEHIGNALASFKGVSYKDLLAGTAAMTILLAALLITMEELFNLVSKASKVDVAMIAILVGIMGLALKNVATGLGALKDAKIESLIAGTAAIVAILMSIILLFKLMEKINTKAVFGLTLLLPLIGVAVLSISAGLSLLKDAKPESVVAGAAAISAILLMLAVFSKMMNVTTLAAMGPALIAVSVGILAMALALSMLAFIPFAGMIIAVAALAVTLGILFVLCKIMKPMTNTLIKFAAGLTGMAIAMVLTAGSIFLFTISLIILGASLRTLLLQISVALQLLEILAPVIMRSITHIMEECMPEATKQFDIFMKWLMDCLVILVTELRDKMPVIVANLIKMVEDILYELQTNDRIRKITEYLFNIIWQMYEGFMESLITHTPRIVKDTIEWLATFLESVHKELQTNGERIAIGISDIIADLFEILVKAIYHLFERLGKLGYELGSKLGEGLRKYGPDLKNKFISPIQNAIKWVKDRFTDLYNLGKNIVSKVKKGVEYVATQLYNNIIKPVKEGIDKIKDIIKEAFDIGKNLVQGFIDGVNSLKDEALGAINYIGENTVKGWKIILGENSPSVIAEQSGIYWLQGYINGLREMAPTLYKKIESTASGIITAFDAINDKLPELMMDENLSYSITPIVDMNAASKQMNQLINSTQSSMFKDFNPMFSGPRFNITSTEERIFNVNNKDVVSALSTLNDKLDNLENVVGNLRVYMDTNALVGQIKNPLNTEFGKMTTRVKRRV